MTRRRSCTVSLAALLIMALATLAPVAGQPKLPPDFQIEPLEDSPAPLTVGQHQAAGVGKSNVGGKTVFDLQDEARCDTCAKRSG